MNARRGISLVAGMLSSVVVALLTPAVGGAAAPVWYLTDAHGGPVTRTVQLGTPGDSWVAGDWDGNGTDGIGVTHPGATGPLPWYLTNQTVGSPVTTYNFTLGNAWNMFPIAGDWNNDGKDTAGVVERRYNGPIAFYLSSTLGNSVTNTITFGTASTDVALVGDWNGDGVDTPGVYNTALAKFFLSNDLAGGSVIGIQYGTPDGREIPIVGDWNGDGKDTIGVVRVVPNTAPAWHLRNTNTPGYADVYFQLGNPGDRPIVGDWNGDGIDTAGVVRTTTYAKSAVYGGSDYAVNTEDEALAAADWLDSTASASAYRDRWNLFSPADRDFLRRTVGYGAAPDSFASEDLWTDDPTAAGSVSSHEPDATASAVPNPILGRIPPIDIIPHCWWVDRCGLDPCSTMAAIGVSNPCPQGSSGPRVPRTPAWWKANVRRSWPANQQYASARGALKASLGPPPADKDLDRRGWAAHHIVAAYAPSAAWTRIVMTRCFIHPSNPILNGVYMRNHRRGSWTTGQSSWERLYDWQKAVGYHEHIHTKNYYNWVNSELSTALNDETGVCNQAAAEAPLEDIRGALLVIGDLQVPSP